MIGGQFIVAASIIRVSGYELSRYGDQIAERIGGDYEGKTIYT